MNFGDRNFTWAKSRRYKYFKIPPKRAAKAAKFKKAL